MLAGPDWLVIFGGNRIADLGAGLGKGIRNFKKNMEGDDEDTPKKLEDNSRKSKE
jgi:sec-independent protein translocase protein TatA